MNTEKVVFTTHNVSEAHMVRGVLEAAGVRSFVYDENLTRIDPLITYALGGVRVVVADKDFAEATKILQAHQNMSWNGPFTLGAASPSSENVDPSHLDRSQWDLGAVVMIVGFLLLVALAFLVPLDQLIARIIPH